MIRRIVEMFLTVVVLFALAYLVFLVPLERRTLFEHVQRVVATPAAEELGREVKGASKRLGGKIQDEIAEGVREH